MSEVIYICNKCDGSRCITTHKDRFNCPNPKWGQREKYQITEIPEPVWVLDIQYPVQMHSITAAYMLKDWDGKVVTVNSISEDGFEKRCDQSTVWFPSRWLKQKPAKPTVEELQERLRRVISIIVGFGFNSVDPKTIKFILDISNGEA